MSSNDIYAADADAIISPTPPKEAAPGQLWYNGAKKCMYFRDENNRWISTDFEGHVLDVIDMNGEIDQDKKDDAYDRAMRIL